MGSDAPGPPAFMVMGSVTSPLRTSGPLVSSMMATPFLLSLLYSFTRSTTAYIERRASQQGEHCSPGIFVFNSSLSKPASCNKSVTMVPMSLNHLLVNLPWQHHVHF